MSGMWRKTLVYLGLVEEDEGEELPPAAEDDKDTDRWRPPRPAPVGAAPRHEESSVRPLAPSDERGAHVRPLERGAAKVAIVRARSFDDAQEVGERYRGAQPILLDLGEVDAPLGRRLLDFVSGVIFSLRGRIVPAGQRAFLLVPDGTDVPLEERRRLADLGYHVELNSQRPDDR